MGALVLIAVGFVGTFIWPISTDAAVTAAEATKAWHPLLLGLFTALGQPSPTLQPCWPPWEWGVGTAVHARR